MTTFDAAPPHDQHAEFALLAVLITGDPVALETAWKMLRPADFYTPTHAALAGVISGMPTVDPSLVVAAVRRSPDGQQIDAMLRLLPALVTWQAVPEHVEHYAAVIAGCARRRSLQRLGQRLYQQASSDHVDADDVTIGVIAEAEGMLVVPDRALEPSPTADEFLASSVGYDWLIPGLIERGDRVMLTGVEGGGKSTLTRQFAVCAAAGVHPFTGQRLAPLSVLLVDLENGRAHLQRKLAPLIKLAKAHGDYDPARLRVESKPAGVDLADLTDVGWFTDKIAAASPDLLIVGPLYRMHTLSLDKEEAARGVTVVLDQVRASNRCAMIVEAHAGHGFAGHRSWRPTGSSLFLRWPEFGYGLLPKFEAGTAQLVEWRGPRDERDWPKLLRRGSGHAWPWLETLAEVEWAS